MMKSEYGAVKKKKNVCYVCLLNQPGPEDGHCMYTWTGEYVRLLKRVQKYLLNWCVLRVALKEEEESKWCVSLLGKLCHTVRPG